MKLRTATLLIPWLAAVAPTRASADDPAGAVLTGSAAFGDWSADAPGVRRLIRPGDLPPAVVEPQPVAHPAEPIAMQSGTKPLVPAGFDVTMVTSGLQGPRAVRVAPNGDLFVANSMENTVRVFRIPDGGATPTESAVFAQGLRQPFGIAFYPLGDDPQWVYVANADSVVRFPYRSGNLTAFSAPEVIVTGIPWSHHWTRDLAVSPDGTKLFLSIGSGSNVAEDMSPEPRSVFFPSPQAVAGLDEWIRTQPLGAAWDTEERRASVITFDPDGRNQATFATGLRNCAGLTVQPRTGALWCAVNERDGIGGDTPFEYVTSVEQGHFYGWPWYFIGANEDPRRAGERADLADKVTTPDVLMQAHSAPLQIVFYENAAIPEYQGSAFVTMHGSWNRDTRTGYKVVRVPFDAAGRPTGEYEDFATGFVLSEDEVWGRPVGVAVGNDGALYVTEDGPSGTIWRITKHL